ncbi:MAG: hypothetical protein ACO3A2_06570 [Bdellovibrionia bacterium]
MELNYDWRKFQSLFYLKKEPNPSSQLQPIYLFTQTKTILYAFSDSEDLAEWMGSETDALLREFPHREIVVYDQERTDQCIVDSLPLSHYYDQTLFLRNQAKPQWVTGFKNKKNPLDPSAHFLLQAIEGWWQKLLPSNFGIFIRLDGVSGRSLLMIFKRGRLDSFQVPDLSGMIPERKKHSTDVVRHLSENYLVPIQGLFVTSEEWKSWSKSPNPWPEILKSIQAGSHKMTPRNWGLLFLIACRAYLGI